MSRSVQLFYIATCITAIVSAQSEVCGGEADVTDYPYQLSFWLKGSFRCSAALLSVNHAITSAHCLNKVPVEWEWTLRTGDGQERIVGWFVIHNMNLQYDYDVVILTVTEEFVLSATTQPIALPKQDELLSEGDVTEVTAWVTPVEVGRPLVLEKISMPILDFNTCDVIYLPHLMTDRMYCAGRVDGGNETCQIHSGAPMVYNSKLVGFYTLGYTSQRPDYPSAYTKIGELRDWINAATGL